MCGTRNLQKSQHVYEQKILGDFDELTDKKPEEIFMYV